MNKNFLGLNSVNEAMKFGVPLICVPIFGFSLNFFLIFMATYQTIFNCLADQDYNSAFVEHRQIGRHIDIRAGIYSFYYFINSG